MGDSSVMRGQLDRLAEASELPNVAVRISPLCGDHLVGTGGFIYMKFPQVHDVPLNDLVMVEHLAGSHYIEEEDDAYEYQRTFEALEERSLSPRDSLNLIVKVAQETWS
jgi:hypothetical protein